MCQDKSTTYLSGLGYNCVKVPDAGFEPLLLIGKQSHTFNRLGPLNKALLNLPSSPPSISTEPASNVSGEKTDKLDLGGGVNLLGTLISALGGGSLGIAASFTDAHTLQFTYNNVIKDSVYPVDVGKYLYGANVDPNNLVLKGYVSGDGELYCVIEVIKSNTFSVHFQNALGGGASVNIPLNVVTASLKFESDSSDQSLITFTGTQQLGFGFICYKLGIDPIHPGQLTIVQPVTAGTVDGVARMKPRPVRVKGEKLDPAPEHAVFRGNRLLDFGKAYSE